MPENKPETSNGSSPSPLTPFLGYMPFPAMREEMERMTKAFFGEEWAKSMARFPSLLSGWPGLGGEAAGFFPALSQAKAAMSEGDEAYTLTVELPGLDENDIQLTLDHGGLMLKAEKKDEQKRTSEDYHFTERHYGSIRRRFALPPGVDAEGMQASFAKGVLTVTLPKTKEARGEPRRIPVSGA